MILSTKNIEKAKMYNDDKKIINIQRIRITNKSA